MQEMEGHGSQRGFSYIEEDSLLHSVEGVNSLRLNCCVKKDVFVLKLMPLTVLR